MKKYFYAAVTLVLAGLFTILVVLTFFEILFKYEGRWFPVIEFFNVESRRDKDGSIFLAGKFTKIRDCEFKYISVWMQREENIEIEPLKLDFLNGSPVSLPIGKSSFSEWRIAAPEIIGTGYIHFTVIHQCHGNGFWLTRTPLISIEYPRDVTQ